MTQKLTIYFQNVADVLAQKKKVSEVFPNPVDVGQNREGILKKFLEDHLPHRCKVLFGGFIFDSEGNESSQIDLIVINDLTLRYDHLLDSGNKSFVTIEGCYAVISVKSNLDKRNLEDSLKGFSTIPKMPKLQFSSTFKPKNEHRMPIRIIFAFSGLEVETIKNHLEKYYQDNPTPKNEQVRFIIVNNKFIIIRTLDDVQTGQGQLIPKDTFHASYPEKFTGAYALQYMLTDLQDVSNIGSNIILNFGKYLDNTLNDYY